MEPTPAYISKKENTNKFNGVKSSENLHQIKEGKFQLEGQREKVIKGKPPSQLSPVNLFEICDTVPTLGVLKTEEDTQDRGAKDHPECTDQI